MILHPDQQALIAKLWAEGRDTLEIAHKLGVSENVVWNHFASRDRVTVLRRPA